MVGHSMTETINAARDLIRSNKNIDALKLLSELQPQENIEAMRLKAFAYFGLAEYEVAIDIFKKILSTISEPYLYIEWATCYAALRDEKSVLEVINKAISLMSEQDVVRIANTQSRDIGGMIEQFFIKVALQHYPNNLSLLNIYGLFLKIRKNYDGAIACFAKATGLNCSDSEAWYNMGQTLEELGEFTKALDCLNKAVNYDKMSVRNNLLWAQLHLKTHQENSDECTAASQLVSIISAMQQSVANTLIDDDLQVLFSYALEHERVKEIADKKYLTDYWINRPKLISLMYEMDRVQTMQDRTDLLESHRLWGQKVSGNIKTNVKRKVRTRVNNKIRIGLVAGFSNDHVGRTFMPLLKYWDSNKFELYCYNAISNTGELYKFANGKADSFKEIILNASDEAIAQSIIDDNLDVLIDIGSMFYRPRITAFKPAAMQISWLDYPHSSGVPIDYIVADPYTNPGEELLLEKPLILPETWVAIDKELFPQQAIYDVIPEDRNGYITFGTMNSSFKITQEALKLWAEIMLAVPNSRFLYARPETSSQLLCDNFAKYMLSYGIDPSRIFFKSIRDGHMEVYNHIDVALDTFPRTGGTTTCESLWMGVPVVTLVGPCFFERLSYSNLNNSGLGDLCAFSLKEYKDIALKLVGDKDRRRYLKHNLRQQILQHPLGQPERFAKNFTDKIADVLGRG